MADVARKQHAQPSPGAAARERLHAMDDSDVVAAFIVGEERAFDELVGRYQVRLLNFVFHAIGDRERAEDVVQDVFIRVHRHVHRFNRAAKFSTWIYTIASNLTKNELRNRARRPLLLQVIARNRQEGDEPLQCEDTRSRPDDMYWHRHLRALVGASVHRLPEHHRQVFVLRELEGKSYEEIAEITGRALGTVKSRINRARNAFAEIIAPALK